eukprot:Tbor_TRINITY_DN5465_c7_g2::TRINITY_DN5465_c7_g2_i1::g.24551::m.24551
MDLRWFLLICISLTQLTLAQEKCSKDHTCASGSNCTKSNCLVAGCSVAGCSVAGCSVAGCATPEGSYRKAGPFTAGKLRSTSHKVIQTYEEICDKKCIKESSRISMDVITNSIKYFDPKTGVSQSISLLESPGIIGTLGCTSGHSTCDVKLMRIRPEGIFGIFNPDFTSFSKGAIAGGSTRRQLAATISVDTTERPVANPIVCLNKGDAMAWDVSDPSRKRYPVYIKDSLLNTNPNFDYSAFLELAEKIKSPGFTITTFIYTFGSEGVYAFADAENRERITVIRVVSNRKSCSLSPYEPYMENRLVSLGQYVTSERKLQMKSDWILLGALLGGLLLIIIFTIILLYCFRRQRWEIVGAVWPKYRVDGVVSLKAKEFANFASRGITTKRYQLMANGEERVSIPSNSSGVMTVRLNMPLEHFDVDYFNSVVAEVSGISPHNVLVFGTTDEKSILVSFVFTGLEDPEIAANVFSNRMSDPSAEIHRKLHIIAFEKAESCPPGQIDSFGDITRNGNYTDFENDFWDYERQIDLEGFNVRTLYECLEDHTIHVVSQLANQHDGLVLLCDKILAESEALKEMFLNIKMDLHNKTEGELNLQKLRKEKMASGVVNYDLPEDVKQVLTTFLGNFFEDNLSRIISATDATKTTQRNLTTQNKNVVSFKKPVKYDKVERAHIQHDSVPKFPYLEDVDEFKDMFNSEEICELSDARHLGDTPKENTDVYSPVHSEAKASEIGRIKTENLTAMKYLREKQKNDASNLMEELEQSCIEEAKYYDDMMQDVFRREIKTMYECHAEELRNCPVGERDALTVKQRNRRAALLESQTAELKDSQQDVSNSATEKRIRLKKIIEQKATNEVRLAKTLEADQVNEIKNLKDDVSLTLKLSDVTSENQLHRHKEALVTRLKQSEKRQKAKAKKEKEFLDAQLEMTEIMECDALECNIRATKARMVERAKKHFKDSSELTEELRKVDRIIAREKESKLSYLKRRIMAIKLSREKELTDLHANEKRVQLRATQEMIEQLINTKKRIQGTKACGNDQKKAKYQKAKFADLDPEDDLVKMRSAGEAENLQVLEKLEMDKIEYEENMKHELLRLKNEEDKEMKKREAAMIDQLNLDRDRREKLLEPRKGSRSGAKESDEELKKRLSQDYKSEVLRVNQVCISELAKRKADLVKLISVNREKTALTGYRIYADGTPVTDTSRASEETKAAIRNVINLTAVPSTSFTSNFTLPSSTGHSVTIPHVNSQEYQQWVREVVGQLSNSPIMEKVSKIERIVSEHQGLMSYYLDAKDREIKENEGMLTVVDIADLSTSQYVVYCFATSVRENIARIGISLPQVKISIAKSLPTSQVNGNAFRNSYFYDCGQQTLYIRHTRLNSIGEFMLVTIHAMAHIMAAKGDRDVTAGWNDADPDFLSEFYGLLETCTEEMFYMRLPPSLATREHGSSRVSARPNTVMCQESLAALEERLQDVGMANREAFLRTYFMM